MRHRRFLIANPDGTFTPRPNSTRCQCHAITHSRDICPYAVTRSDCITFRGYVIAKACHRDIILTDAVIAGKPVKFSSRLEQKRIKARVTAARLKDRADAARAARKRARLNPKPPGKRSATEIGRAFLAKQARAASEARSPRKRQSDERFPKWEFNIDHTPKRLRSEADAAEHARLREQYPGGVCKT